MKAKVIIADDHKMILEGLCFLLEGEAGIEIIDTAQDGEILLEQIEANDEIDIIILDINMPKIDGIEATKRIKATYPEIKILILSMYKQIEFIKQLIRAGADGYILKNSGRDVLLEAIQKLLNGERFFGQGVMNVMVQSFTEERRTKDIKIVALSEREKEVVRVIVKDMTSDEIASHLNLSVHTINSHRKNILSKLGVKNIAGIYTYALQSGIVKGFDI
ncbi:MAG: response regulator [Crocinitomicaceae bacterium]